MTKIIKKMIPETSQAFKFTDIKNLKKAIQLRFNKKSHFTSVKNIKVIKNNEGILTISWEVNDRLFLDNSISIKAMVQDSNAYDSLIAKIEETSKVIETPPIPNRRAIRRSQLKHTKKIKSILRQRVETFLMTVKSNLKHGLDAKALMTETSIQTNESFLRYREFRLRDLLTLKFNKSSAECDTEIDTWYTKVIKDNSFMIAKN